MALTLFCVAIIFPRMNFKLTYGANAVNFTIGSQTLPQTLPFIEPRSVDITPQMRDIEGSITRALEAPINSPRLKDLVNGERVALIVSDEFRAGQQEAIIKCMMAEIAEGRPKEVWTFCATGSHEPEIYADKIGKWAKKYAAQYGLTHRFFAHDCIKSEHVHIGACSDGTPVDVQKELLECGIRAYGHEGKHHYMAGFSCIDKQVLPGLSSRKTIEGNHKNALKDELSFGGRSVWVDNPLRENNPFSLGCYEARRLADMTLLDQGSLIHGARLCIFGLDMISDTKHIYWAAAGDTSRISKQMVREADRMAAFNVEPTRYVVISPGGPPASQTIYSVQNCFDMALSGAILDGGEALIIAPCEGRPEVEEDVRGLAPDIKPKELFYDNLARLHREPLERATKWIDDHFELYLWKTDRVLKLMNRRGVKLYLYSTLPDEKVEAIGFRPVKDIQAWIDERAAKGDSPIRVIDHGNKILVMSAASQGSRTL